MNTLTLAATLERAAKRQTRRNRLAGRTILPVGALAQLVNSTWTGALGLLELGRSNIAAAPWERASKRNHPHDGGFCAQNSLRADTGATSGSLLEANSRSASPDASPTAATAWPGATTALLTDALASERLAAAEFPRSTEFHSSSVPTERSEASQSGSQELLSVMAFALLLGGALYI